MKCGYHLIVCGYNMITNTLALSFFMLIYTSLASKLPPSISADKQFVQVEEGPSGLNKALFTITAKELNGGNVEVIPTGLTNDIVKIIGTNNTATVTMKVFLKKALDRETKSSFTLNFSAVSNDQSLPSSQLSVSLFVLDINDEPPKFSQIAYRIELLENHTISNDIGANVSATDPDNGLGGLVTYTLKPAGQASGLYSNTFGMDKSHGKIKLLQSLDYEKLTFYQYKIHVIATLFYNQIAKVDPRKILLLLRVLLAVEVFVAFIDSYLILRKET
ncbi:protocadherin beta-3-like [Magallana gigas]|uniref:protocadherin beta-3-like n=1 Tax=Magallana gigas TaxID=29159 RepID=UPI0033422B6C